MDIASRNCSAASAGPSVRTVAAPPCFSTRRTASSTAHSSCGLTVKPSERVSISIASGVKIIFPPVAGTRLMQTRMFIRVPYDKGDELHRSNLSDARMKDDRTNYEFVIPFHSRLEIGD